MELSPIDRATSNPLPPGLDSGRVEAIHSLATEGIDLGEGRLPVSSDPFWKKLRDLGTELWLDTGDLSGAERLWASEFSALTTNNTLLNIEVQRGIYDDLIRRAAGVLSGVDPRTRVLEIAFLLNARHGLRLVQRFGGRVSVEEHTDLAHDVGASVSYGVRFSRISKAFIVKLPFTPAGLIATRWLRQAGVPVNLTLGFSARQNFLAAAFAGPSYVNVFLGRLGAYVADNRLGDGSLVGEKATLASQRIVAEVSRGRKEPVLQIAASMRSASQVADLAGVDVYTMPLKVAETARKQLDGNWVSRRAEEYRVALGSGVDPSEVRLEKLWDVSAAERAVAHRWCERPPGTPAELVAQAREGGAGDLFPVLSDEETARIASDGKIPKHQAWTARIRAGEVAIDTLLNLAGLASFAVDQKALDDRIRRLVS